MCLSLGDREPCDLSRPLRQGRLRTSSSWSGKGGLGAGGVGSPQAAQEAGWARGGCGGRWPVGGGGRLGKEAGVGFGAPKRQMIQLMTASGWVGTAGALGAVPVTSRSSVDTPGPAEAAPGAGGG